jgi:hypothetical protein
LQALDSGYNQRDATIADYANTLGKSIESLEFEAGEINALELFGGIQGIW